MIGAIDSSENNVERFKETNVNQKYQVFRVLNL